MKWQYLEVQMDSDHTVDLPIGCVVIGSDKLTFFRANNSSYQSRVFHCLVPVDEVN